MKHAAIHWPDHAIGKRESHAIREAHNALYNDYHETLTALRVLMSYVGGWDEPGTHHCGVAARVLHDAEPIKAGGTD